MRKLFPAIAAALLAASAAADDPIGSGVGTQAGVKSDFSIDEKIALEERSFVPLHLESRGVIVTGVRIKDRPTADQLAAASGRSSVRPELEVTLKSEARREMRVFVEVTLEDEAGNVLLSGKRAKNLDSDEETDVSCPNAGIYLRDWPRVKFVHLKVEVAKR
jgi:hypothetical protein